MVLASFVDNRLGILEKIKAWKEKKAPHVLASHQLGLILSSKEASPWCVPLRFFVGSDVSFLPLQPSVAPCEAIVYRECLPGTGDQVGLLV